MRHPIIEEDLDRILSEGRSLPWERLEGKTVLVTGASGFLPAYMTETMLRLNERPGAKKTQVIALARNRERAEARFAAYRGREDLRLLVQDASDAPKVGGRVDYVIHAASQASPRYFLTDPVGTLMPNVLGTHHLLELARASKAEGFLFFSSGDVYGRVDPKHCPVDENAYGPLDPTDVRSCYGEGKRIGETMCACWAHQHGVPAKIVRVSHTYGPGMRLDDGRVFADFVADVVAGRDIVMKSDGRAMRAFCYLADATAGFFTALFNGTPGQAYNVGNDKAEISILELAETLVRLFPEKGLRVTRRPADPSSKNAPNPALRGSLDITKIAALGWQPHTTIEEGFRRTVRSFG